MSAPDVRHVSTAKVQPASYIDKSSDSYKHIDLNSWDLTFLGIQYMQKGFLFEKPQLKQGDEMHEPAIDKINRLKTSLSHTLDHFFPLTGRLGIEKHEDDGTIYVYINCNFEGAEFIHATAEISVEDILSPTYNPQGIIDLLFPLNRVFNYEGHSYPLLSIQVTQLLDDSMFIGCSLNHSVFDGTSFWHFINSWSEICRSSNKQTLELPPVFDRWFTNEMDCPLRLPATTADKFLAVRKPCAVVTPPLHDLVEKCFRFTKTSVAKLKAAANSEMIPGKKQTISSLQAVLAHVWIAAVRARKTSNSYYNETEDTLFGFLMNNRTKLIPLLPEGYCCNSLSFGSVIAKDSEVLRKGFKFLASLLNEVVNSHSAEKIISSTKSWIEKPFILSCGDDAVIISNNFVARSSQWVDKYGNDFGWGRPIAVKTGRNGKSFGITTVSRGPFEGSIDIEICLPIEVLEVMENDAEFMEAFST
ncbi:hypothetical protein MKW98_006102 [Papaver atlanticum]|uniref:HXXXD-type acyl-transferase family protein n=1 Tax=Papaver atlanticum TaxID=357466 RepID=A0AAD4TGB2_9MAGN|nr:hypothetical protein MKW98_006102 [Papaver atlanticum]